MKRQTYANLTSTIANMAANLHHRTNTKASITRLSNTVVVVVVVVDTADHLASTHLSLAGTKRERRRLHKIAI